ncbi:MAG: hydroxylamine reductase [Methanomassiliicoccales archaeon]|nr:MAG: hydroxylamine reductase [Methanomassiliicoccales archaeon]
MYCNQCQQTAKGVACTSRGVCGKNEDVQSLQEMLIYGLKGIAAYAYHCRVLGRRDEEVDAFMHEALFKTLTNVDFSVEDHFNMIMKAGMMNYKIMGLLDRANSERFGEPTPTTVFTGIRKGPGILVTGHDLVDLEALLEQTEGTGVNVYTHGEMLPAHGYPGIRKYEHLIGNYGSAWQKQKTEFAEFGGPILATTNCVLIPPESYKDRLYTTGITAIEGVRHIDRSDYSEIISHAKKIGDLAERQGINISTGFHHKAVLALAPKIIDAVKSGKIRHFFLIGGCDGATPGRDYYTQLAEKVPKDCVILTLACGKYRFNDRQFGTIAGTEIPRLLDIGQCNDTYSALQIAMALSQAFGVELNKLPLSIVLSWFEQKAVAIVYTLLALGVRNVRIGPTLPAFVSPNNWKLIQERFNWMPIGDVDSDLKAMLG